MEKLHIERHASDNKYLHRDFHCALDQGLAYLGARYGADAVDAYLIRFAKTHYAPLIADAKARGLSALREHIREAYEAEEAPDSVRFAETDDELTVFVSACPAVAYMHGIGYTPSPWYEKTSSTVNRAIANALGIGFTLVSYDAATGAAEYRFYTNGEL